MREWLCFTCTYCNLLSSWTRGYLFQWSLQSEGTGCFLEEAKFDFVFSSWKYLICFCFRVNIFINKISDLRLTFWAEGTDELWILIYHYTKKWQKNKRNQGDVCFICIVSHFLVPRVPKNIQCIWHRNSEQSYWHPQSVKN